MPRSGGQECDCPAPSCRVAECRGDLGEVGRHGGGLDVGEGLGVAGLVGVSDDGDPARCPASTSVVESRAMLETCGSAGKGCTFPVIE
jgi:hypothetical protein